MNVMPKPMAMLAPAMLLLAGCAPSSTDATGAVGATKTVVPPTTSVPVTAADPAPAKSTATPPATTDVASISGAIREGNRPPPALRVCATPVDGGAPTCVDTAEGARAYRIEVAPGHYYLLGWVHSGELTLIAHASQTRCMRAPCPPDELISVAVTAGQQREGIDLNGSYVDLPAGWPKRRG